MIKKLFERTFWRFILVSIINTAIGTGVMFGCYNLLGLSYWVSSAANYIVGSIVSYFLNKNFTFKNREQGIKPIVRFVLNISICYLAAYGLAKPFVRFILSEQTVVVQENGAMLVGMCLFVGLNYLGQKFFAFKESKSTTGESKWEID